MRTRTVAAGGFGAGARTDPRLHLDETRRILEEYRAVFDALTRLSPVGQLDGRQSAEHHGQRKV